MRYRCLKMLCLKINFYVRRVTKKTDSTVRTVFYKDGYLSNYFQVIIHQRIEMRAYACTHVSLETVSVLASPDGRPTVTCYLNFYLNSFNIRDQRTNRCVDPGASLPPTPIAACLECNRLRSSEIRSS